MKRAAKKTAKRKLKGRPQKAAKMRAVYRPVRWPPDCIEKIEKRMKKDGSKFSAAAVAIVRDAED